MQYGRMQYGQMQYGMKPHGMEPQRRAAFAGEKKNGGGA